MSMFPEICISLALAVLVVFVVLAVRNHRTSANRFSLILGGICVSSFFLFLPVYWKTSQDLLNELSQQQGIWYPTLRTLVYSLYYSLKVIAGGQQIAVLEKMEVTTSFFQVLYSLLNYGYFMAAPLMTSGLILSTIGDLWDRIRYRLQLRRSYHIFSDANPVSMNMATQIREKESKAVLVFCGCKDMDKKRLEQLRKLGALCLYASCEVLKLPFGKKKLEYYLVEADEDGNLRSAERLIIKHHKKEDCRIIINAQVTSGTGIQVVESMDKGSLGVRFFDGTALLCSNLLLRHPIYAQADGVDTLSVVVVGCGQTGVRMVKTVAWCAQIDGKTLKVRVYDRNAGAVEQKFLAQCPELAESCDLAFCQVDVTTAAFEKQLMEHSPDAVSCIIALGDDEENMEAAERVFRLYRSRNHYGKTPAILARVRGAAKTEIYSGHENAYLKDRGIHTFGGVEDALATDTLFHSALEWLSFAVDLCYWGLLPEKDPSDMSVRELKGYLAEPMVAKCRKAFLHSEYSRRSSMAVALHIPTKLHSCGVLPAEENLPSDETARRFRSALEADLGLAERLAKNEHQRWNAFMRSEGYCSACWEELLDFYPQTKNNQDPLSKRHLCITGWENLEELNRKYLELDPPVRKNFKKSDFDLIRGIPKIIMLANRLNQCGADLDM